MPFPAREPGALSDHQEALDGPLEKVALGELNLSVGIVRPSEVPGRKWDANVFSWKFAQLLLFFILTRGSVESVAILTSEGMLEEKFFVDVLRGEFEFLW